MHQSFNMTMIMIFGKVCPYLSPYLQSVCCTSVLFLCLSLSEVYHFLPLWSFEIIEVMPSHSNFSFWPWPEPDGAILTIQISELWQRIEVVCFAQSWKCTILITIRVKDGCFVPLKIVMSKNIHRVGKTLTFIFKYIIFHLLSRVTKSVMN